MLSALTEINKERKDAEQLASPDKYTYLADAAKRWVDAWPNQSTHTDYLRASGMYWTCPREFILNYWSPTPNKSFDYSAQMKMAMGTHLHCYLQNCVLGPMGVLYGFWQNTTDRKDEAREGFHPDFEKALWEIQHQHPLSWEYVEYNVRDEHYRISGHIDGIVDCDRIAWIHENSKLFTFNPVKWCKRLYDISGDLALFELKTTGSYTFDKLNKDSDIPAYYKQQAIIYQKLKGIKRTVFWFVEREDLESKCFFFEYDDGWWSDIKRKANLIWRFIKNEELPDSMMACKTPKDKRAKICVHSTNCWSSRLVFKDFVQKCKLSQPDRKWLDLSEWDENDEATVIKCF